jgi:uncharacterized protein YfaS (alpha-2-macroglobulin family)
MRIHSVNYFAFFSELNFLFTGKKRNIPKPSFIAFLLIFLIPLILVSCQEKQLKTIDNDYPLEVAKVVSNITSGIIPSNASITVRFVSPAVEKSEIGKPLDITVFSFEPRIKGATQWKDERTLVFTPEQDLPLKKEFLGKLNLKKIVNTDLYPDVNDLEFSFKTLGREISQVKGDFILQDENNPENVSYQGEITLNVSTTPESIREAVSLTMSGQEIPLEWSPPLERNTKFSFKSAILKRDNEQKRFTFNVKKEPLDISDEFHNSFNLEKLDTMKVTEVNTIEQEHQPGFEVVFTDKLDTHQDIKGFVMMDPPMEVKLKTIDKKIIVLGDFKHGREYSAKVSHGIKSVWGTAVAADYNKIVSFDDMKPQISFTSDGVFLPSANQQKLYFKTLNLSSVKLEITKVFESNMGQFLQTEKFYSLKNSSDYYDSYNVERIGVNVADQVLEIGEKKNSWLQHELDLSKIIKSGEKGLFLVTLSFEKKDMLYQFNEDSTAVYDGDNYYNNPNSEGYVSSHGTVLKALIKSDIGLTYKKGFQQHMVFASDIISAAPLQGVKINIRSYQNQILDTKTTDSEGKVVFDGIKSEVFYVEGELNTERSVIQPNEMAWNLSTFDTGGEEVIDDGTRAFIYTERGVYRPGDLINVSVIARNDDNTFPENHPLTMKIYNPRGQMVYEQTNKAAKDGFYNFPFQTNDNDMTGNWGVEIIAGSRTFNHLLKIETVIPNRLKIKFEPGKKELFKADKVMKLDLISKYLFGNPAADLDAEVNVVLANRMMEFKGYPNFIFSNESIDYKDFNADIFKGKLNKEGKANIEWKLPDLSTVPGGIDARISARVIEKGGRDTKNETSIPVSPYDYYVGLEKPVMDYGYTKVGNELKINTVLLNNNGKPVPGRNLKYRIYKNNHHWWWEYDNENNYRIHYKNDTETELLKEGSITTLNAPVPIIFNPDENGEYFIEVQDSDNKNGHTAGFFFSASYWGESVSGSKDDGILTLKSDKKNYQPGETATVSFPIPEKGEFLVSIEKANKILKTFWYKPAKNEKDAKVEIPVTAEMMPTSYFTVSVIQPHAQTVNDRPIRMYGVLPLNVEDQSTHQAIDIKMADVLQAKKPFTVEVQTQDKKATQFTVAVVDEGLLDLTNFKTPDSWNNFYKKLRLGVSTYDLFSYVIGANKGDIYKTFSVGGDLDYRINQQELKKVKRFKLVSMFQGPLMTDENGYAKVNFAMPEYLGSVRVMVVTANKNRYGMAEKAVPVKSDLMVLPTIPRVLGPQDSIILPVTIFATKPEIKNVEVSLKVEGPVEIDGPDKKSITFSQVGDQDLFFKLKAKAAVGEAKIIISGVSGTNSESSTTEISVRPSSPRIYSSEEKTVKPGTLTSFIIPDKGISGSNNSLITISRRQKLNLYNRLEWLINYPYGCVEQTTSAVFPQLFLREFIKTTERGDKKIDNNINSAIKYLRKFQINSGAFSYWPGQTDPSIWGSNYAGHFLIEAQKLGYNVPDDLMENWFRFQKEQARNMQNTLMERTYRVYLLALAGQAEFGAMNLLKENELKNMSDVQKWMLAGAYQLAGVEETAKQIYSEAGTDVKEYTELNGTYGSGLRDKSIILEMLTLFKQWDRADKVYNDIVRNISSDQWFSTQTAGYSLMALGKYMIQNKADFSGNAVIKGYLLLPDGKKVNFDTKQIKFSHDFKDSYTGKKLEIYIDKGTTVKNAFVNLEWNGIPLHPDERDLAKNLSVNVEWLNENGKTIDPSSIIQGTTFWGHFTVENISGLDLQELALTQVFPAGWEIENTRLSEDDAPAWMAKYKLNQEKYFDIRDDRVMWFFDLPSYNRKIEFVVRINAITEGQFSLAPTVSEAMYDRNYKAVKAGKKVTVKSR